MRLDWSEQSPHIRTLYRPWKPGDGYDEATLQMAEARLYIRLPTKLRNFYLAWGQREDLTQTNYPLLYPNNLVVRADTLIFWVDNQAVFYWGVRREALEESDPPVVITESGPSGWRVESELHWKPSHPHLSNFLDDVTYLHAFCGGAIHGGYTQPYLPDLPAHHIAWLEEHWSKAAVTPLAFGVELDPTSDWPVLYVREGQAFWSFSGCSLAVREAADVDEIAQRFQITWARRW